MNFNKEITWNIAGAFVKHDIIVNHLKRNKLFNKFKKISVYDGLENCTWNGGRLHSYVPYNKEIKDKYYDLDISIALTFTNHTIDLKNPTGNFLLEEFHKKGNKIILVNDELRRYIKKNFPNYSLVHSITACGEVQGLPLRAKDINFYKEKLSKYDMIVPRCDCTFDNRLRELDLNRLEILISDTCILNCPHFEEHFKQISQQNAISTNASSKEIKSIGECWLPSKTFKRKTALEKKILGEKYPFYLNHNQLRSLIIEGLSNFKIQGREASNKDFLQDLEYFVRDYNNAD